MGDWTFSFCNLKAEREFLELPKDVQARLVRSWELFSPHGPAALTMPLARPVEENLWGLRASGRDGIARSLYVLDTGRELVILRSFAKKTQKTPRAEIELAWSRWSELS